MPDRTQETAAQEWLRLELEDDLDEELELELDDSRIGRAARLDATAPPPR